MLNISKIKCINHSSINEVSQKTDIKFSLGVLGDDGLLTQIIPWCKCKDYLQDTFWAQYNKSSFYVHGLIFEYSANFGDPGNWIFMIKPGKNYTKNLQEGLPRLNKLLGFAREDSITEFDGMFFFQWTPSFTYHGAIVNSIALLVRCLGLEYQFETLEEFREKCLKYDHQDAYYIKELDLNFYNTLISNRELFKERISASYPQSLSTNMYGCHNYYGIISTQRYYSKYGQKGYEREDMSVLISRGLK